MSLLPLVLGAVALAELAAQAIPWQLRPQFQAAVDELGSPAVDVPLLMALAWKETGFHATLVSAPNVNGTRDYGLMQVNSINLGPYGLTPDTAVTDVAANIRAATQLLGLYAAQARNRGDLVSMYNAGPAKGGGPKLQAAREGTMEYVNAAYVNDVLLRYWFVRIADLAPFKGA